MMLFCCILKNYIDRNQNEVNLQNFPFVGVENQECEAVPNYSIFIINQNLKPPDYEECINHPTVS